MIRTLLCSTALIVAVPAMAQTAAPAPQDPSAAASQPATQAAAPANQAAPAGAETATPAAAANSVATIVDSEFPAYDGNKDGQLDKAEFGKWMVALKDQEMKATGKTLAPAEVTAWASGAFTTADADKSSAVSKVELVTYLSGGAG